MKQLSNKIIFVFLLAMVLSFAPAYKADANLLSISVDGVLSRDITGGDGETVAGSEGSIHFTAGLDNSTYIPRSFIKTTVTAYYSVCSNTPININVVARIDNKLEAILIDNDTVGGVEALGTNVFIAPTSEGTHYINGRITIYSIYKGEYVNPKVIDFSIPFTVVAPTPKSMTIDVYKNGVKVPQGADKVISQAVQSKTELLITYTPSGLSFPFNCDEPVSKEHSTGYTRTFSSQADVISLDKNPDFTVLPDKTTNYSVTCYN